MGHAGGELERSPPGESLEGGLSLIITPYWIMFFIPKRACSGVRETSLCPGATASWEPQWLWTLYGLPKRRGQWEDACCFPVTRLASNRKSAASHGRKTCVQVCEYHRPCLSSVCFAYFQNASLWWALRLRDGW